MKPYVLAFCGTLAAFPALAADYSVIDPGDVYYINRFGKHNSTVQVVRKLESPRVKVQDLNTGATSVEDASDLLSETELRQAETKNKALGWGRSGCGFCEPQAAASKAAALGDSPVGRRRTKGATGSPGASRTILPSCLPT